MSFRSHPININYSPFFPTLTVYFFIPFMHNVKKWPYFENLEVSKPQDVLSMFGHFSTLCMKGLKYNKSFDLTKMI